MAIYELNNSYKKMKIESRKKQSDEIMNFFFVKLTHVASMTNCEQREERNTKKKVFRKRKKKWKSKHNMWSAIRHLFYASKNKINNLDARKQYFRPYGFQANTNTCFRCLVTIAYLTTNTEEWNKKKKDTTTTNSKYKTC